MVETAASLNFKCQACDVRDTAICGALKDDELRELGKVTTEVSLRKAGTLFYEQDESTYLFNVITGVVCLSKLLVDGRRQITGLLFPGDFLGLSVAGVYAYTAEALTDMTLCRFERTQLTRLLDRFPNLEHRLLELASNELVQAQDHMVLLGRKTAVERVSFMLVKLSERIGRHDNGGCDLELPMGRADLADYLGLTTETVSRTITRLRNDGLLETRGGRSVYLPDTEALARQAEGY